MLVEFDGKLYSLSRATVDNSLSFPFGVLFDPKEGNWSSLLEPPSPLVRTFLDGHGGESFLFSFVAELH
ncbi:hypothetical protein ACLB2K_021369 [Fragaria x ananassa]